jgi:hypothetical protein
VYASRQSDHVTCVAWGNGISILKQGKRTGRADDGVVSATSVSALASAIASAVAGGQERGNEGGTTQGKVRFPGATS